MARQRGFSLIEMVVVVVIMGILLGLGLPSYRAYMANQRIVANAEVFMSGMQMARAEAVKAPPHGQLHGGEGQKPEARGGRQIFGRGAKFGLQHRGQHRQKGAVELAQHIGRNQAGNSNAHQATCGAAQGRSRMGR